MLLVLVWSNGQDPWMSRIYRQALRCMLDFVFSVAHGWDSQDTRRHARHLAFVLVICGVGDAFGRQGRTA